MSLFDYQSTTVTDFAGAWLRPEPTDVPPDQALLSLNCEFNPGQVSKRKGFKMVWNPNEPILSLFNWVKGGDLVSLAGNYAIYFTSTGTNVRIVVDLATPVAATLFSQAGAASASIASGGSRLYIATATSSGIGAGQARVVGIYVAALNTDKLFMGPISTKPILTDTGTGVVTAGIHRVGYVIVSRNGFTGKISPVAIGASTFDTTSVVTSTGSKQIGFSLTATWPAEASLVYIVMTSTTNLNRYFFVPGLGPYGVPGGGSTTITATIDISDDDLISTATEVTDNFNLFTQDSSGNGPFNPFLVVEYGQRVGYFTELNGVFQYYFSEPANHQTITADQHVRYLPGFRKITSAFVINNLLYVLGPHWTYSDYDNLLKPVQWAASSLIDGRIGTLSTRGVSVNSSQGFAWVADVSGLYVFQGGSYAPRPVSYQVDPDWKRINWAAAMTVQVKDNNDKQQVYVLAPLDGATSPTHILVFDYSNGLTPETIKYSLWSLASYAPGSMEMFQNPTTKKVELWTGRSTSGKVLRQMNDVDDITPYNDDGVGVDATYEMALQPGMNAEIGSVWAHYGAQVRVKGSGSLAVTSYSMDRVRSIAWQAITMALLPGKEYTKQFDLKSEGVSHRFSNSTLNEYFILSAVRHFYDYWIDFRP